MDIDKLIDQYAGFYPYDKSHAVQAAESSPPVVPDTSLPPVNQLPQAHPSVQSTQGMMPDGSIPQGFVPQPPIIPQNLMPQGPVPQGNMMQQGPIVPQGSIHQLPQAPIYPQGPAMPQNCPNPPCAYIPAGSPFQPSVSPSPQSNPSVQSVLPSPESMPTLPQLVPKMLQPVANLPASLPNSAPQYQGQIALPMATPSHPSPLMNPKPKATFLTTMTSGDNLFRILLVVLFFVCVYLYFKK